MPRSPKYSLLFRICYQNPICSSQFSHSCYMSRMLHPSWFDPRNISRKSQIMNLLVAQPPASPHLLSLRLKCSLQHPVLKHRQFMSFHWDKKPTKSRDEKTKKWSDLKIHKKRIQAFLPSVCTTSKRYSSLYATSQDTLAGRSKVVTYWRYTAFNTHLASCLMSDVCIWVIRNRCAAKRFQVRREFLPELVYSHDVIVRNK
jgi:hypothetical protein